MPNDAAVTGGINARETLRRIRLRMPESSDKLVVHLAAFSAGGHFQPDPDIIQGVNTMQKRIALLRGINVGGRNKLPMAELRTLCGDLGWHDVETYIQSGNIVFSTTREVSAITPDTTTLETDLSRAIAQHFNFTIPVIIRTAVTWHQYIRNNPFGAQVEIEPQRVLLALSQKPPATDAADMLQHRAAAGEQVRQAGDALWIHFPGGVAHSKLAPTLLDRLVGSPVTTRNWRTVLKLAEMAEMAEMAGPSSNEIP